MGGCRARQRRHSWVFICHDAKSYDACGLADGQWQHHRHFIQMLAVSIFPSVLPDAIYSLFPSAYADPVPYSGSATIQQMYSNVNSTHWTLVYKCNNCFLYDDPAVVSTKTATSKGTFQQGWAQALTGPTDPTNPNSDIIEHDNGMGLFNVIVPLLRRLHIRNGRP